MTDETTVAALTMQGIELLAAAADDRSTVALDAQLLLAHALGLERWRLTANPQLAVRATQRARYRELLERRRAGEPLAYLTGRREFWSLDLAVSPDVLVPRPETELVVERALA